MNPRKWLLCCLAGCLSVAAAGCATLRGGSLEKNSARLEDQTREFYSEVRAQTHDGKEVTPVTRAAESLILSTRDFNRAVERRATQQQMLTEFDRVARDYKQLTDSLAEEAHGGRNQVQAEKFERVTEAYHAVENSMPSKQAETTSMSLKPSQIVTLAEIERRTKMKDFWFP